MGGPGSGHGIKRPDHSARSGTTAGGFKNSFGRYGADQVKGLKSVFSNLPDPSCHQDKLERDRALMLKQGQSRAQILKSEKMTIERTRSIGMQYGEMQDAARRRAEKAMQVFEDVIDNPDASDNSKIAAAKEILDRAFGKAATLNLNVNASVDAKPSELSDAELAKRIEQNLTVIEGQRREAEALKGAERPKNLREYN